MAKVRLDRPHYLGNPGVYYEGGRVIDWDGPLSQHMTVVDEPKDGAKPKDGEVPIPDDWEDLPPAEIVALARKLGAAASIRSAQATAFIHKEVERRAAAAKE